MSRLGFLADAPEAIDAPIAIYRPQTNKGRRRASVEYQVFLEPEQFEKWRRDKESVPLISVVQAPEVFERAPSSAPMRPSKQTLDNVFGTHDKMEVIQYILEHGEIQGVSQRASPPPSKEEQRSIYLG